MGLAYLFLFTGVSKVFCADLCLKGCRGVAQLWLDSHNLHITVLTENNLLLIRCLVSSSSTLYSYSCLAQPPLLLRLSC